jgi:glutamate transport system permease protein
MLLSWFAGWVARRQRRNPKTEAVEVAPDGPGPLLPGEAPPTADRP